MGVADILIIAAIAVVAFLCVRSIVRSARTGGECATCPSGALCSAADRKAGRCMATDDMLKRMEAAADQLPTPKAR